MRLRQRLWKRPRQWANTLPKKPATRTPTRKSPAIPRARRSPTSRSCRRRRSWIGIGRRPFRRRRSSPLPRSPHRRTHIPRLANYISSSGLRRSRRTSRAIYHRHTSILSHKPVLLESMHVLVAHCMYSVADHTIYPSIHYFGLNAMRVCGFLKRKLMSGCFSQSIQKKRIAGGRGLQNRLIHTVYLVYNNITNTLLPQVYMKLIKPGKYSLGTPLI
ncbi:hypothetical protein B0H19DRAFT_78712 [Mycena capillaripes]|nr:hypothetical protein B0H19DRAFT_78712 [Mycena capillaripes]